MLPWVLLALVVAASGAPKVQKLDSRIVGGTTTTIEEFPYQVSLLHFGHLMCGGIIISKNFVITAGHCTDGIWPFSMSVRVGSNTVTEGGQVIGVAEVHQHPLFDVSTMDYDISILRLAHPINYSPSAMPIGLVPSDYQISPDANFIVTGWGTLTEGGDLPSQLQVVKIPYLSNEQCQKAYGQEMTISARMFCAAASGKDSCQGDSGGPVVADGLLVGVVSWGFGCARPEYPGVYSRISELRAFVRNVTRF